MSDDETSPRVFCLRNHRGKDAAEHKDCPYCFGDTFELIAHGDRKLFCDFDPDEDPDTFGFPEESVRNRGR